MPFLFLYIDIFEINTDIFEINFEKLRNLLTFLKIILYYITVNLKKIKNLEIE